MKKLNLHVVAGLVSLAFSSVCLAAPTQTQTQEAAQSPVQETSVKATNCDVSMPHPDAESFKKMREQYQANLHDKLQLNAKQEASWKTYIGTMKDKPMKMRHGKKASNDLSAPERLQMRTEFTRQHLAQMEKELVALKAFYAELTPEQQKVFDTETAMHHPMHRRGKLQKN